MRFREPAPVNPLNLVAYLEAGILNRAGQAVVGAGSAKGEEMAARLEDAQGERPCFRVESNAPTVPRLAHEAARGARIDARCAIRFGRGSCFRPEPLDNACQVIR